jgi:hypothetical protein
MPDRDQPTYIEGNLAKDGQGIVQRDLVEIDHLASLACFRQGIQQYPEVSLQCMIRKVREGRLGSKCVRGVPLCAPGFARRHQYTAKVSIRARQVS